MCSENALGCSLMMVLAIALQLGTVGRKKTLFVRPRVMGPFLCCITYGCSHLTPSRLRLFLPGSRRFDIVAQETKHKCDPVQENPVQENRASRDEHHY